MRFKDIEPFIRFAEYVKFSAGETWGIVRDCRLLYILSGAISIHIKNKHYNLRPGSLFYCCRGQLYSIESPEALYIAINFDLTQENNSVKNFYPRIRMESASQADIPESYHISDSEFINSYSFLQNGSVYFDALNEIVNEITAKRPLYEEKACVILKSILIDLHRNTLQSEKQYSDVIKKAVEFINNNFDKPISNQTVAALFGYHQYYFNRIFTQQTGKSLHKYLLSVRLTQARKMMLTTDLSLSVIAEKVGFCNYSNFSSFFKKETGLSPISYRESRNLL